VKAPPKRRLAATNRSFAPYGLIVGALVVSWELLGKLTEHMVLGWISDHVQRLPLVVALAAWSLAHPFQVLLTFGVAYCLFVIAKATYFSEESAVAPPANQPDPVLAVPATPAKQPHFAFVGLSLSGLYTSFNPREGVRPPSSRSQEEAAEQMITLRFTNLAKDDGSSKAAANVVARMRLYSADWMRSTDIDYAVWVGSPCETADINVGGVREVVLLVYGPDNSYYGLRDMRHTGRFELSEEITYVRPVRADWIANVEVILTDQRSHVSQNWVLSVTPRLNSCEHHEAYPPPQAARLPH